MRLRTGFALLALPAALSLAGCAKNHAAAVAPVAPPAAAQIRSSETGLASWYGHPYHGRVAADGEIYDMEKLTAAHRTLPFGTVVRVTNVANGKTVDVRVIDRGPFVDGRIIDLSHAAAESIGSIGVGVARVRVDVLSTPAASLADNWFAVQAGAFLDKDRAERLRASLEKEYGSARLVLRPGSPSLWRVLAGRERTEQAATLLQQKIRTEIGTGFVVRIDQPAPLAGQTADSGLQTQGR
ncbi:MAG: septal ring lytic transglycosylase RlpA family protein [Bryobacteraceae bacterium]|jgi:rare lipoprotein A